MKKQLKIVIAVLIISIIGFLGFKIGSQLNHKKEVAERIQSIPDFSFKTLSGDAFTHKDIDTKQPKLFVYFNSDCDFCHAEAQQIYDNLEKLKGIQVVFISFEPATSIKVFAEQYKLANEENIVFLEDVDILFSRLFDAKSIPYMLLYSKDNDLIKKFKGSTKIENILKALN